MSSIINVVLPVFGLILAGYVCRRTGRLGETASSELNRFVVWLALPALLFKVTATSTWEQIWQPGFIASVSAGCVLVFVATVIYRMRQLRRLADASIDGLSAAYANTGFLGIPLCVLVLGDEGLLPAIIATLIVACLLFAVGIVLVEISLQEEKHPLRAVFKVSKSLATNPLLIAPLLGGAWAASTWTLAPAATQFLSLLGMAATPCALVSLGLFLAQKQEGRRDGTAGLVAAKLVLQPLVTGFFAFRVFELPALWANSALLLSALPTGTGPFMLASFYN
ncbi:MAG TPA: AEC family transporter, partial [Azonexus sp.]|nr:AEC family transporter [Azonexus sp.]